jgi:Flp pilus assembly protein TadG
MVVKMKNLPRLSDARNRERGAVAMLVAVMWTTLFGMAVLAIDFGYLYTKRRNLQAIADSAVRAAMPVYVPGQLTPANGRASAIANANGVTSVVGSEPGANQYRVTVARTYPTFFGSLFGLGSRDMTAKATGMLNSGGGAPAIYAGGPGCTAQFAPPTTGAIQINGGGQLVVNGDIATFADRAEVASWGAGCAVAGTCKVTGSVKSPCAVYQDTSAPSLTLGGTSSASTVDPVSLGALAPLCTVGNLTSGLGALPWQWNAAGNCYRFVTANEVYCSNADIQIIPPANANICTNASFISTQGVTVQTDGSVNMTAATGAPPAPSAGSRLLIYAGGVGSGDCGAATVWVTAGAGLTTFTLNGTVYAPNGCIHVGSNTMTFRENGLIDAKMVFIEMGAGKTWTFTGPTGGVSTSAWSMVD